jgi:beta-fructofuranosidase
MISRRSFVVGCCFGAIGGVSKLESFTFADSLRSQLASDPRRPQFHLLPTANWMNDPNGPVFWNGKYHMFYQYNPDGAYWGNMHWGHAWSTDMVHWRHLPVALAPTPGGPDAAGVFSGTACIDRNQVAMIYTGVTSVPEREATIRGGQLSLKEAQCLAYGSGEDLTKWTKDPRPVLAAPPAGLNLSGFRDPSAWQQGDWWYLTVGSGTLGKGGSVLLYRSKSLCDWEYLHILTEGPGHDTASRGPVGSGDMWECPEFFPLGDKHVLIYSTRGKVYWQVGSFDTSSLKFHPERNGILDHGAYYAAKTQLDKEHNRIVWGWIQETRPLEEYRAAGWAGLMSLPRILSLDRNSNLSFEVAPAVKTLRQAVQTLQVSNNEEQNRLTIASMHINNCCGEIACVAKATNEIFGISLFGDTSSRVPWLAVRFNPAHSGQLLMDENPLPVELGKTAELDLHFYIDGSVIEVFANNRLAYTKRFYYSGGLAPRASIAVTGKTTDIRELSMWQLSPISGDRLTS